MQNSFESSDAQRGGYTQFSRATHFSFQILLGTLKQGQSLSTNRKYACDKWLMMKVCTHDTGTLRHADDHPSYNGFCGFGWRGYPAIKISVDHPASRQTYVGPSEKKTDSFYAFVVFSYFLSAHLKS